MIKKFLLIMLLIFSGCTFGQERPDVVATFEEQNQVRAIIYEFASVRFDAYLSQIRSDRLRELEKRWTLGLTLNSKDGAITLVKLQKLTKRYNELKAQVEVVIAEQKVIDEKCIKIIEIDKEITKKHKEYMMAGMSAEQRGAIKEQITNLVKEAIAEHDKIKALEVELNKKKSELEELMSKEEEGAQ